jgi:hypothetical protein
VPDGVDFVPVKAPNSHKLQKGSRGALQAHQLKALIPIQFQQISIGTGIRALNLNALKGIFKAENGN